jgi:hypothetical protein
MNRWVAVLFLLVLAVGSFMIYFGLQYTCVTEFTEHGHPIKVCVNKGRAL